MTPSPSNAWPSPIIPRATDEGQKIAIMGALTLYLDFINIFIYLLRLFGDRK